ncbi:MAG: DUF2384 domain-containing protein [Chitinophagaceae bacterium]|nr:DUF2384 domain-containing protein [Chitinophagaceae bacterium]
MDVSEKGKASREEVFRRAEEIFEDQTTAWLNSPIPALGGQIPAELLGTPEGIELVLKILGRIEYGVYS